MSPRTTVKNAVASLLCGVGIPALARRGHHDRLAVLMFHGVEPEPLTPPCWHVLDVNLFRRELEYVRRYFHVLPLAEALERLSAGTLPPRAVAITFDDGTRNLATVAAPVLRELNLPAAVFLATGPMDTAEVLWPDRLWLALATGRATEIDLSALNLGTVPLVDVRQRGRCYAMVVDHLKDLPDDRRLALVDELVAALSSTNLDNGPFQMLTWADAHKMAADGLITLYPHSVTHPILSRCPDIKVEREIVDSCATLERETGYRPAVFAYPNGRPQDFDTRATNTLQRLGVRWALSTTTGFADAGSDPLALPRLGVGSDMSFAYFSVLLSGGLRMIRRR